mmetsp:Transcript_35679/g.70302  ORF Transcript_35679/g.70302 Transcript_35679/m.70302 type:complete len:107 (-) Transcript_35679:211-531(-)
MIDGKTEGLAFLQPARDSLGWLVPVPHSPSDSSVTLGINQVTHSAQVSPPPPFIPPTLSKALLPSSAWFHSRQPLLSFPTPSCYRTGDLLSRRLQEGKMKEEIRTE